MKKTQKQARRRTNRGPSHVHEGTVVVHRGRVYKAPAFGSNQHVKMVMDLLTGQDR